MATARPQNIDEQAGADAPQQPGADDEVLIGRYRVLARRGTGGFGNVYACWDTRLQRRVAIKRMPLAATGGPQAASTVGEALREARTASLLAHPNIVAVHDFEADGSYAYLVMEYVDGLNLAELLDRVEGGTLTNDETAQLVRCVGAALAFAHDNGVLHLDIKPTNILIDRSGQAKLADFGMATLASAAGYADARGGTVGYMPPEQIEGGLVDERTDVFSLAVVAWQALTGENPFAAADAGRSLSLIERGARPGLSKLAPDADPSAVAAIEQALAPDPRQRTASVRQLVGSLESLGDADAGAASLARLLSQSGDDDAAPQEMRWDQRHLPPITRYPWLEGLFERGLAFACVLAVALRLAGSVLPRGGSATLVPLAMAALSAAWPPAGSLLVGGLVAWGVATADASRLAVPLALLVAAGVAAWWAASGRRDHLATPGLVLGSLVGWPQAGSLVAAFAQAPAPALATGVAGCALSLLLADASRVGLGAQVLVGAMAADLARPATWAALAGAGAGAWAGSSLTCRGSVGSQVAGQLLCMALLLVCEALPDMVEKAGIWSAPDARTVALAVGLCAIGCVACVIRGPLEWGEEG